MRLTLIAAATAGALMLGGCGGDGDDALGQRAEDQYENKADAVDDLADNAATDAEEEVLEDNAEALRETGEEREEMIDDSDVDADDLSEAQKNAVVNSN